MQSGPSKEELKEYWKNSRQYFDELAKTYLQSDPEYYEEYIAPFYRSPLYGMGGGKRRGGSLAVVSAIFFLAIGAGAAFFIFQNQREKDSNSGTEKTEPVKKSNAVNDTAETSGKFDYEKGLKYFDDGDYDNAEKYLRKVKGTDENYSDARKKLNEIKMIKKKKLEEELNPGRRRGVEGRR